MIEFIFLLIIICAVISALRKPRTFAEAEYAEYQRTERRGFLRGLVLVCAFIVCIMIFFAAVGSMHP